MFNQLAASIRLEHRHSDGSWNPLQRSHHDPADHDPERGWSRGEIFQCSTCDEEVRVVPTDDAPGSGSGGAA
jgi:hypothetical protein